MRNDALNIGVSQKLCDKERGDLATKYASALADGDLSFYTIVKRTINGFCLLHPEESTNAALEPRHAYPTDTDVYVSEKKQKMIDYCRLPVPPHLQLSRLRPSGPQILFLTYL